MGQLMDFVVIDDFFTEGLAVSHQVGQTFGLSTVEILGPFIGLGGPGWNLVHFRLDLGVESSDLLCVQQALDDDTRVLGEDLQNLFLGGINRDFLEDVFACASHGQNLSSG